MTAATPPADDPRLPSVGARRAAERGDLIEREIEKITDPLELAEVICDHAQQLEDQVRDLVSARDALARQSDERWGLYQRELDASAALAAENDRLRDQLDRASNERVVAEYRRELEERRADALQGQLDKAGAESSLYRRALEWIAGEEEEVCCSDCDGTGRDVAYVRSLVDADHDPNFHDLNPRQQIAWYEANYIDCDLGPCTASGCVVGVYAEVTR